MDASTTQSSTEGPRSMDASSTPNIVSTNVIDTPPTTEDRLAVMNNPSIAGHEGCRELCKGMMSLEVRQQSFINCRLEIVEDAVRTGSEKVGNLEGEVQTLKESNEQLLRACNTAITKLNKITEEQERAKKEQEDVYRFVQESEWSKRVSHHLMLCFLCT